MAQKTLSCLCLVAVAALAFAGSPAQAQSASFFLTSAGPGKGADLGGIEGADKHCQSLAQAAGAGSKTWHAYLSTQAADGKAAVNAKDRIGKGPWQNVKGVVIAKDVADLHGRRQQSHQGNRSHRKRRNQQRRRRQTEPSRRADGIAAGWHCVRTRDRPHLQELDEQHARVRPWSAIPTARVCATTTPRTPGIRRIPRADPTAAARRPTSRAPAATACCIASR